jgi:hypothetical protein
VTTETEKTRTIADYEADLRHEQRYDRLLAARVPLPPNELDAIVREEHRRDTDALAEVSAWMRGQSKGAQVALALLGGVGSGKTTAGAAVIAWIDGAAYTKSWRLAALFGNRSREMRAWDALVVAPFLFVDEFGAESDAEQPFATRGLLELLDERLGTGPTLIAANLNRDSFLARFDTRAADRARMHLAIAELTTKSMRTGSLEP